MSRRRGGGIGVSEGEAFGGCNFGVNSWILGKARIHDKDIKEILQVVADLCKRMKQIEKSVSSYDVFPIAFSDPHNEPYTHPLADGLFSSGCEASLKVSPSNAALKVPPSALKAKMQEAISEPSRERP